ncbi:uncharacterized protein [Oryza sativa Japonica Group]|uniref:uncharacterized protein n=1 Tax=Oryza sativa subsp. japonica TaxID=39947 RepID=UPI00339C5893
MVERITPERTLPFPLSVGHKKEQISGTGDTREPLVETDETNEYHNTANSAYRIQFVGGIQDNRSDFFWKAKVENKCKFFGWLMIHRKILTADKLQLRGWDNSHICPLCGVEPETATHLLMECAFAKQVWRQIWLKAGLHMPVASTFDGDMLRWWSTCRREMAKEQRRNFDGLFICTAWGIWLQRNARIFNGTYSTVMQVVDSIIAMCKAYVGAHVLDE